MQSSCDDFSDSSRFLLLMFCWKTSFVSFRIWIHKKQSSLPKSQILKKKTRMSLFVKTPQGLDLLVFIKLQLLITTRYNVGSITSRCSGKWAHALLPNRPKARLDAWARYYSRGGTKTGLERAAESEPRYIRRIRNNSDIEIIKWIDRFRVVFCLIFKTRQNH